MMMMVTHEKRISFIPWRDIMDVIILLPPMEDIYRCRSSSSSSSRRKRPDYHLLEKNHSSSSSRH